MSLASPPPYSAHAARALAQVATLRCTTFVHREPLALMLCGFMNTVFATVIWVFGVYGEKAGIICLMATFFCVMRIFVIFSALSNWKNRALKQDERKARTAWRLRCDRGVDTWQWVKDVEDHDQLDQVIPNTIGATPSSPSAM